MAEVATESPESSASTVPTGTPTAAASGTPASASAPSPTGASSGTPAEDRSTWIPPHRLSEETHKRRQLEQQYQQATTRLQERERQLQAMAGVTPSNPAEADNRAILEALVRVAPQLKPLLDMDPETVNEWVQSRGAMSSAIAHQWNQHGQQTVATVISEVGKLTGGDLTKPEADQVHEAFYEFVAGSPARATRYEHGESTQIVQEFLHRQTMLIDRAKRLGSQSVAARTGRPVPSGRSGGPVATARPTIDFSNPDAVIDAAFKSAKERGLDIGGRG